MPRLIAENKAMYPSLVCMYLAFSILLLTLSLMRLGAELYHHYITKDHFYVWKRMALPVHCDNKHINFGRFYVLATAIPISSILSTRIGDGSILTLN
jgi:cytochrome b561